MASYSRSLNEIDGSQKKSADSLIDELDAARIRRGLPPEQEPLLPKLLNFMLALAIDMSLPRGELGSARARQQVQGLPASLRRRGPICAAFALPHRQQLRFFAAAASMFSIRSGC
jgi:hypothetical protein